MTEAERKFWRAEFSMLDQLYEARQKEAQRLIDMLDLRFKGRIRDLKKTEYVRISEFYPAAREIISTIAMNYPHLLFEVTDDEAHADNMGMDIEDLYERGASSLLEITQAKAHVTQGIMDALFCRIGWVGVDYNPPGDDILPPWTANSQDEEDLVSFSRRPPFFVHVDPMTPPHMLGHARYIREKMWVPLKYLRDDKSISNRKEIQPTKRERGDQMGFGELMHPGGDDAEQKAVQDAVENGEFVLVDRVHVRSHVPGSRAKDPRRMVMFAPGVDEPIKDVPHPFMRRTYDQRMGPQFDPETGTIQMMPLHEPDTGEPILDLETKHEDGEIGRPGRGWLVPNGFPLIPVKLDMHPTSFYPQAHLAYLEDMQLGIVESMSRIGSLLKRFSRQGLVKESEIENNPRGADILDDVRRGEDGQYHVVIDPDNWQPMDFGAMPSGQTEFEDRLRMYIDRISKVRQLTESSRGGMSATQAALIGAAAEVNQQWGEAAVSEVYVGLVRAGFTIMGDPRFTPEAFLMNVAPDGVQRFTRALTTADFQWNYRIEAQAGSMSPMFVQMQQDKILAFYDRAMQDPQFDRRELAKMLADAFDRDPEKLMVQDGNPEAMRAAQLENRMIVTEMQDPGVLPDQDHRSHEQAHATYQQDQTYQQLAMAAQQLDAFGRPADPRAGLRLQQIDAIMGQHRAAHQQAQQEQIQGMGGAQASSDTGPSGIIGQVRSNANETADTVEREAAEESMR